MNDVGDRMAGALAAPAFPGDSGEADPELAAVLAGARDGTADPVDLLRVLAGARVFVALSAQVDNGATDKHAQMVLVSVAGRDGRRALPVFTSVPALLGWGRDLRPVPVEGARAAVTALDDGAAALLVDPGQATTVVVTGSELEQLAAVWTTAAGRSSTAKHPRTEPSP